jgi:hypothetical protein
MFILSFVVIGGALGWQHYLESKTGFPPLLRTSILLRSKGKFIAVCFVIVSVHVIGRRP